MKFSKILVNLKRRNQETNVDNCSSRCVWNRGDNDSKFSKFLRKIKFSKILINFARNQETNVDNSSSRCVWNRRDNDSKFSKN